MKGERAMLGLVLIAAGTATAADTVWWTVDAAAEMLAGRGEGVAVTAEGRLERAAGWHAGVAFEEPVLLAAGRAPDGSVIVGTGHPAALYRVTEGGAQQLAEIPGDQVTALLVMGDDEVLVAAGSPAVLYRWRRGGLDEVGRLGEGGIWELARFAGQVVAAAGPPAALYRLGERGFERWVELPDVHARCLAVLDDRLLVGTSGRGLVVSVDRRGRLGLVVDSQFTEISDLVAAPDGTLWAAALVGEPPPPAKKDGDASATKETSSSSVSLDLPKVDGKTASSEVVRVTPEGALLGVHRFTSQVATALAFDGAGLLVGTGYEGEVWRFVDGGGARLATVDAVQVVGFVDGGAAMLTLGPARLDWRRDDGERPASFRSEHRLFPRPVRFGEYRVVPWSEGVRIRFRSGASEIAEDRWLPWSEWRTEARGLVDLPPGRSLQWELELPAGGDFAGVDRIEVASREVNLPPVISLLEVEEPGVIFLDAPPTGGPVIEVSHPDREGIFTVVDSRRPGPTNSKAAKGKKYYRAGYRTVSWQAEDPNGDPLLYELVVEREDGFRLAVRDRVEANQLAVDVSAVPDGRYRFELTASDAAANPAAPRTARRLSSWFEVDSTPPRIELERHRERWRVTVDDGDGSGVARVRWSRDGGEWTELEPEDGVLDGRRETFWFEARPGRHLVVVSATDRQFNRATVSSVED